MDDEPTGYCSTETNSGNPDEKPRLSVQYLQHPGALDGRAGSGTLPHTQQATWEEDVGRAQPPRDSHISAGPRAPISSDSLPLPGIFSEQEITEKSGNPGAGEKTQFHRSRHSPSMQDQQQQLALAAGKLWVQVLRGLEVSFRAPSNARKEGSLEDLADRQTHRATNKQLLHMYAVAQSDSFTSPLENH